MHPAVEQLIRLLPPVAAPSPRDWEPVEQALGTPLPEDYKQLVDHFGGGVFDETFWLLEPGCSDPDYDLLAVTEEREEVLADLWKGAETKPRLLEPEGTRLIPWAYVEGSGAHLYWLIAPGRPPEDWTVMINEGRGPEWEHHPLPCARFLLDSMTGALASPMFQEFPPEEHQFDANADIL
ncbi:SMI1/KNR4 family protein [Streptomyces lycii]|uniref:SMI1/KNR4 family protein n=1 Tax=Streptomyces lycii TaxID=2654337 RepID=A0ABQ7FI93_9ACTN|nr:SMI1/KNR4 family protein [Streptomyces lycii]KAF4407668.1 SMI1/KNR4 family protein [Streptomyces lycii]